MRAIGKLRKGGLVGFLAASLLFSSGCALFLVGAAGTGGYLIRKGEEGSKPKKKKGGSRSQTMPSSEKTVELKEGPSSKGEDALEVIGLSGGVR